MVQAIKATYTEPATLPENCVRVRWKGKGHTTMTDFQGWRVRLKQGETLVVAREAWDNINDPDLPANPNNWELLEE